MLNSLFSFILALGILVFIHEYGHYSVARYYGVRVIRFSVGFGKPILKWVNKKTQVEWTVGWIPLGGYVRMLDERDPDSMKGTNVDVADAFNRKPVGQRIAIVLAGPMANLILAALIYGVLAYAQPSGLATQAAAPTAGSVAQVVGLQDGDTIRSINGTETVHWNDVGWNLIKTKLFGRDLTLEVERGGQLLLLPTVPAQDLSAELGPAMAPNLGFFPIERDVTVRSVNPDGAGQAAGFLAGDVLRTLDGQPVQSSSQFTRLVQGKPGQVVEVGFEREGRLLVQEVRPEAFPLDDGRTVGRLGLGIGGDPIIIERQLGPIQAAVDGVNRMVEVSVFSLVALGKMITGGLSWEHLSGPVSIASAAGQSSSLGILPFFGFLAMVSVSLGILNLLPIPLLDGGHLMYYFAEIIRGKPVDEVWQIRGQKIGLLLIGVLTSVALFNDIQRLIF